MDDNSDAATRSNPGTLTNPAGGPALDSLAQLEWLAGTVGDVVFLVRARDGRILGANAAAIAMYGYDRETLLASTVRDLRAPDTNDDVASQIAEADARGVHFETVHRRKDGTLFSVEVSARGSDVGDERVLVSVVRDVTGRVRAEAALQESEARFRSIFEGAPVPIGGSRAGQTVFVNGAYARLFGFSSPAERHE